MKLKNAMKNLKMYEEVKEEILGDVFVDSGSIVITDPANISDELKDKYKKKDYKDGAIKKGTIAKGVGGDGAYKVIARWNDFKKDKSFNNIPDEIIIKLQDKK